MRLSTKSLALMVAAFAAPALVHAQFDFTIDGKKVQVHSFASQGFLYSNQNNYLSVPTSKGSFAFTDGGANISTQLTDKFRVGAQMYIRNVGEFGNWHPQLDWALGDYRFTRWFGVRAGKVKTTLGLYNDVQDMDSLHMFAMLPESIYPVDWRAATIAHNGGDVYGDIDVKHLGTFSYTGYAGMRPQDSTQGYIYALKATTTFSDLGGLQAGGDLRWTTPFGAVFGTSYRMQDITANGTSIMYNNTTFHMGTHADNLFQYYGQYSIKNFRLDVEYRRNVRDTEYFYTGRAPFDSAVDTRAWYVAGTYRISKRFEVGAYRSEYIPDQRKDTAPAANHQFDTVVGGRVNLTDHLYAKVEGHFFDGAPTSPTAARGFYTVANPAGILPTTNMLVVRTGVSF